jgi:arginine decarboxylase-like protein
VRLNRDGSFDFAKEMLGDTIADVLSYVEYEPKQMELRYRNTAERAVQQGRITAAERQQMIKAFRASMQGYTYYEREH